MQHRLVPVFVCVLGFFSSSASAWVTEINGVTPGGARAYAVAADADGNVVAAGFVQNRPPAISADGIDFAIVKMAAGDGHEIWRYILNGSANVAESALAVAVDSAGDVFASGDFAVSGQLRRQAIVVKVSKDTGAEIWRRELGDGSALHLALDATGDVIVANSETGILKFRGSDGVELWSYSIGDRACGVALDGVGDVAASFRSGHVRKLSGMDGHAIWTSDIGPYGTEIHLYCQIPAVDVHGDVIQRAKVSTADRDGRFGFFKFAGADGSVVWYQELTDFPRMERYPPQPAAVLDPAGNLISTISTGQAAPPSGGSGDFAVIKLSGADGTELWRRQISTGDVSVGAADAAGDIVAVGNVGYSSSGGAWTFLVVKLSGSDGHKLWRRDVFFGSAYAVTLDPDRNVIAAGEGVWGAVHTLLALKFAGFDGGDLCTAASTDGDGICDIADNCASIANADQADRDGDRVGDPCDNCPDMFNTDQLDTNSDGVGDACEIAGRGSWTYSLSSPCTLGSCSGVGQLDFDDADLTVFGVTRNLSTLGPLSLTLEIADFVDAEGGEFTAEAASSGLTLSISSTGGSLGGLLDQTPGFMIGDRFPFIGRVAACNASAFPDLCGFVLVFDAESVAQDSAGLQFSGRFVLRAFRPVATPVGTNVTVETADGFRIGFTEVLSAGETEVLSTNNAAGILFSNFQLPAEFSHRFVDVVTSATFTGPVTFCAPYADVDGDGFVDHTPFREDGLRTLHSEAGLFVDRTDSTASDPVRNLLCSMSSSFSAFSMEAGRDLVRGGGSRKTDCLMEWVVDNPKASPGTGGHAPGRQKCTDGDLTCDFDRRAGECTFNVAICFNSRDLALNAGDPGLPVCAPETIDAFDLGLPSARTAETKPADGLNRDTILGAVDSLGFPIRDANRCTAKVPVVVPLGKTRRGFRPAGRTIKASAVSDTGKTDADSLTLKCLPQS